MQEQLIRARGAWGGIPRRAQLAIVGVTAITIAVMFVVVKAATATTWVPATDRISQAKLPEAQATLEKSGIRSRLGTYGGVEVPEGQLAEAAAKLAEAGIAGAGAHTSCEKMNGDSKAFMASTSAQQRQRDRSCLQNEIQNMIEAVGPVERATVTLTLPESELFTEEQSEAKAAVAVDTGGSRLSQEHVRAITSLTSNAVKDLQPGNVAIVDESGHPYSADTGEGSMSEAQLKLRIEALKNSEIEGKLTEKFEEIAGTGKVKVVSNVELDMDRIRREVKDVGGAENERGPKVAEKYDDEVLNRDDSATGGTAGTGANVNGEEGTVGADDDNGGTGDEDETGADNDERTAVPIDEAAEDADYLKSQGAVTYAADEVREAITVAQGGVLRHRMSVVVDTSVAPETANEIKNVAQTYLGGNPEDSFSFGQARIAKLDEERATTQRFEALGGYVKWALLGLGLIGMAFFVRRTLNQRTQELLYPMDDLLALEPGFEPIPLKELEAAVSAASSVDNQKRMELERKVGMIANEKPQEVAQMLRGWLHDVDSYGNRKAS